MENPACIAAAVKELKWGDIDDLEEQKFHLAEDEESTADDSIGVPDFGSDYLDGDDEGGSNQSLETTNTADDDFYEEGEEKGDETEVDKQDFKESEKSAEDESVKRNLNDEETDADDSSPSIGGGGGVIVTEFELGFCKENGDCLEGSFCCSQYSCVDPSTCLHGKKLQQDVCSFDFECMSRCCFNDTCHHF